MCMDLVFDTFIEVARCVSLIPPYLLPYGILVQQWKHVYMCCTDRADCIYVFSYTGAQPTTTPARTFKENETTNSRESAGDGVEGEKG